MSLSFPHIKERDVFAFYYVSCITRHLYKTTNVSFSQIYQIPENYFTAQGANVVNYNIVNSNGVKIGSRTSYICNVNHYATNNNATAQPEGFWSKPKQRPMPPNVEELSTCDEELTFDDMITIKTHVGHGWKDVARRLSYSDGQIEQFEENYRHRGIDEVNIEFCAFETGYSVPSNLSLIFHCINSTAVLYDQTIFKRNVIYICLFKIK